MSEDQIHGFLIKWCFNHKFTSPEIYIHTDTTKTITHIHILNMNPLSVRSSKVIKAEINDTARIFYLNNLAGATQTATSKFQDKITQNF